MGLLEIGLTIWAWNRGWKIWALLPVGIGICLSIFLALVFYDAGVLNIKVSSISGFLFIDAAVNAALVIMVIKTKQTLTNRHKLPIAGFSPDENLADKKLTNTCRIDTKNRTTSTQSTMAKLVLINQGDIDIDGIIKPVGRVDFEGRISPINLRYISKTHFWIRSDKGNYFIEDYNSANGTKLNGMEIKGKGLYLLKDGDMIDMAGIAVLTFKVLQQVNFVR